MSYTMTLDIPERTTEFVRRREARLRPALNSIVVAFVTSQMLYEMQEPSAAEPNGKRVFDAIRDCPVDIDLGKLVSARSDAGRLHPIDFASLLREEA